MAEQHPPSPNTSALKSFSRALQREAHVLTRQPDLLWQQIYNRLHWEEGEIEQCLDQELALRNVPGATPWIRLGTPHFESKALVRTLRGHIKPVTACAFSPDGRTILSGSDDGNLRLWDPSSGQTLHIMETHSAGVLTCAFSPDGKIITCTTFEGLLLLWDSQTGQSKGSIKGPINSLYGFSFSPDWSLIVSNGINSLQVWEVVSGRTLWNVKYQTKNLVYTSAFSPDGRKIAYADIYMDEALQIREASTGQLLNTLEGHEGPIYRCAFSPNGRLIATTSRDNSIRIWEVNTGSLLHSMAGDRNMGACGFSPNGRFLAGSFWGNSLRIYDSLSGQPVNILEGHTGEVKACNFSPDGHFMVSASNDATLRIWDITQHQAEATLEGREEGGVKKCLFTIDGKSILSSGTGFFRSSLNAWDSEKGASLPSITRKENSLYSRIEAWAISPDGHWVISSYLDNILHVWEAATGETVRSLKGKTNNIHSCAFSPDGNLAVSGSADGTLIIWDLRTGLSHLALKGHKGWIWDCAFSPDGRLVLSASADGALGIWSASTGWLKRALIGHIAGVKACAFSPDGIFIASASSDKTVRIWHTSNGRLLHTLEGHTEGVNTCAFTFDGRLLISAGEDKMVYVWEPSKGTQLAQLPLPGKLTALALHHSSLKMVCGDAGGILYWLEIAGIDPGPIITTAWQLAGKFTFRRPASLAFGCHGCGAWTEVSKSQLGQETSCPQCSLSAKLNPFTISGDWHRMEGIRARN
jgi:WD40 repeat protein